MLQETFNKNYQLRIRKSIPKQLPKPSFVPIIERNYQLSKINQNYQFPRTDTSLDSCDEMEIYGVYDLNQQNNKKIKFNKHLSVLDVQIPIQKRRLKTQHEDNNQKPINLSLNIQRIKTEVSQDNISIKLPSLKFRSKKNVLQLRSISNTICHQ
ncbi:unnamed protein product [Paramecium primaurelia]|uniref:Uncharacterized protein n=1 Tax=Paramecium primaurelia TaxID=5886 RepID=A0A8S1JU27_PARPR|nr:unnamed protein product [Paramecium primaurelia]